MTEEENKELNILANTTVLDYLDSRPKLTSEAIRLATMFKAGYQSGKQEGRKLRGEYLSFQTKAAEERGRDSMKREIEEKLKEIIAVKMELLGSNDPQTRVIVKFLKDLENPS